METPNLSRREFVKNSIRIAAALPLASSMDRDGDDKSETTVPVDLHWLDGKAPLSSAGVTWGVPWPKGKVRKGTGFNLQDAQGRLVALQSWPLAYWPDGSLKWTAHAMNTTLPPSDHYQIVVGKAIIPVRQINIKDEPDRVVVDSGVIQCEIRKKGNIIVHSISRNGKIIAEEGKLVLLTESSIEQGVTSTPDAFESSISKVVVEQNGPLRAVIKIEGKHLNSGGRSWLPFVLRLYFYEGAESIRMMHTMIYDGDENKDFIRGLGIRFSLPLHDELHDRHIRFTGENKGVFAEAVRGLTGLRRDPGQPVTQAQVTGRATPALSAFPETVSKRLNYIPAFGDYTLFQPTPDSFEIQKRTKSGYGWIQSAYGGRSSGTGYLGSPSGGLAFGIRNFWQSHPAQLDIREAHTDKAEITLWLWAPRSSPMDLRFYHDGMGQDTYAKQIEGLEITYEDYEPGFGTAMGIARTSEVQLWAVSATPSNEALAEMASSLQSPPVLTFTPSYWQQAGVFGGSWNTPYQENPAIIKLKKQLDWYFDYYHQQVEQNHWYGFWNYGDVMHTFDKDRHVWRYDVGGFAWDNSELSTDLWLWYYFLYTGRPEAFRMAEAMTRHTGEVDVHHLGKFSPLGSRHNVQHWGCSAKQLRISTVENRRFYYYLTGDERVGDLMREQINADQTLRTIVPGRKIGQHAAEAEGFASISFGTDWGALAAAWFTEWERTGNKQIEAKLLNSMKTIGQQPHGFFTGSAEMELATGKFKMADPSQVSASHLSAVFGLSEICAELIDSVSIPEFEKAWLQYCELYNATPEEQKAALGNSLTKLNLGQAHARLTAFAARRNRSKPLALRAWKEFNEGAAGIKTYPPVVHHYEGPVVLNPTEEAEGVSTNAVAQWGLTVLVMLGMIGGELAE